MSFTTPQRVRTAPVLPLAGMLDMMFLLLIFFMTTSVFRDQDKQIDIDLPRTASGQVASNPTQIFVTITQDNQIYINQKNYTLDELAITLRSLAIQFPDEAVVIRGDGASTWATGMAVVDAAYTANIKNVKVQTANVPGN